LINENCLNLIGSGVAFHVPTFFKELAALQEKGLKNVHDRIFVSDRVSIDLDLHVAVDTLEEVELGSGKLGTTGRGIGPCYSSKAARSGIKLAEVFNPNVFEGKLRNLYSSYSKRYGNILKYDVEEELDRFRGYRTQLTKYAVDAVALIKKAQDDDTAILIEGANALMLDIDYGTVGHHKHEDFVTFALVLDADPEMTLVSIRNFVEYGTCRHIHRPCHQSNKDSRDSWVRQVLQSKISWPEAFLSVSKNKTSKPLLVRASDSPTYLRLVSHCFTF
jgi:hypothetical protein